jgi:hypothetical protein
MLRAFGSLILAVAIGLGNACLCSTVPRVGNHASPELL